MKSQKETKFFQINVVSKDEIRVKNLKSLHLEFLFEEIQFIQNCDTLNDFF